MVKIYYTQLKGQLKPEILAAYKSSQPNDILERISRFKRWEDGYACLFGRLLLLHGLRNLGYPPDLYMIKYTQFNRPTFNEKVDFNISHSGKFIVCAISDSVKLGIDIEEIKDIELKSFVSQWTKEEIDEIVNSMNPRYKSFYLWTRKEAVIKADGQGLNIPLHTFCVIDDDIVVGDTKWYLKKIFISQDYSSHIATNKYIEGNIDIMEVDFY